MRKLHYETLNEAEDNLRSDLESLRILSQHALEVSVGPNCNIHVGLELIQDLCCIMGIDPAEELYFIILSEIRKGFGT